MSRLPRFHYIEMHLMQRRMRCESLGSTCHLPGSRCSWKLSLCFRSLHTGVSTLTSMSRSGSWSRCQPLPLLRIAAAHATTLMTTPTTCQAYGSTKHKGEPQSPDGGAVSWFDLLCYVVMCRAVSCYVIQAMDLFNCARATVGHG